MISVTSSEIRQARAVIDFVNNYIAEQNKKSQIDDAKLEYAKKNDTIEIVDLDGNIEKVWKRETFFGDIVLVADGGTTYHTHADCYESWKDSYKANFKCWKKISITDAKSQGYKLCRICERYYDFADSDE